MATSFLSAADPSATHSDAHPHRLRAEARTLYIREGNTYRQAPPSEILHHARGLIAHYFRPRAHILDTPHTLRAFLRAQLATREHETFALITLDSRRRLIDYTELFRGTLDDATVHPREVVKETLARNAASVILVHNHPSGIAEPSPADEITTRRLKNALDLIDVRVIDHLIVGEDIYSFAEHGLV
jgi:DNA repair protein RadC